jgi:hypothetical protein
LDHEELEGADKGNGKPEVPVDLREDSFEDVDFSLPNLSAVEVVEHL